MSKKWLLSLSLTLLVFVLAACGDEDESAEDNNDDSKTQEEEPAGDSEAAPEMPKPDLEGVPEVVAEVNGEEIPKEEFESTYQMQFQQAAMQSQMTGQEVNQEELKGRIVDSMIGQRLLIQEAENSDLKASQEEIDQTLSELAQQNQIESTDAFITALEEQGMSEKEVMSQIETQVKIDQLIANEAGDIEPSEEELQELYDQYAQQQEQMNKQSEDGEKKEVPSFKEMKPDLVAQVERQKESEAAQALIKKLREDADVTKHL
ncbi:SurA N-terminal domain-containing protein [Virgibacillus byunsanensis]|uniref:peptidylprolyl isomerase n=1 Tax=Virgibacillus byunsanensis TaxID=570945 RepID=A0ABW3LS68_9BACI